ncbi:hypothetical protein PQX77_000405 [Marasmius sp. AFHP31]|nr:hypothetical protein PQX77_000405 [Marasmius sp. AFHP31]
MGNFGRDQNINNGPGSSEVNIERDPVQNFTTTLSVAYKSLWDAVAGVVLELLIHQNSAGKSAIVMSDGLSCEKGLVAPFFFRSDLKRNNPDALAPTIALTAAVKHGVATTCTEILQSIGLCCSSREVHQAQGTTQKSITLFLPRSILKSNGYGVWEPPTFRDSTLNDLGLRSFTTTFMITDCRCGSEADLASSYHSHKRYEVACLQAVKALVSKAASYPRDWTPQIFVGGIGRLFTSPALRV